MRRRRRRPEETAEVAGTPLKEIALIEAPFEGCETLGFHRGIACVFLTFLALLLFDERVELAPLGRLASERSLPDPIQAISL